MRLLKSHVVRILRRGPVRYVEGQIVQDQTAPVEVLGSIQPERNITKIRETFGSHIEAALKIYTTERLRTQEKGCDADVIDYDGRHWEVLEVRKYDDLIPHFKSIAILKKDET
jgi:hypothetical protein